MKFAQVNGMFDELFVGKRLNMESALLFGFVEDENSYRYETDILKGLFRLHVVISSAGSVDTSLIEKETGEEYILYKTNSVGSFVGNVRNAVKAVLVQVAEECCDTEIFTSSQAKEIIGYVQGKYGDELEFLWTKFPDNAVWRRKDTSKWYGAILKAAKSKLGIASDETVEIIDLRIQPEKMESLLSNKNYYPGWHMNKKSWYTIILDGSVATEEICRHIDESYRLAR